jgi:hypothetical protein
MLKTIQIQIHTNSGDIAKIVAKTKFRRRSKRKF